MKIGVLAAQGAFVEHIASLQKLGADAVAVRLPEQLKDIDGLIIPGGESTSICKLMRDYNLTAPVCDMASAGFPVFGTCAGLILLSKKIVEGFPEPLGLMDITVQRNAFGRQKESFETELAVPALGDRPFPAIFIRAPKITAIDSNNIEVLARLPNKNDNIIVAVRQGNLVATAFHPELTADLRFHRYFLDIVEGK